MTGPWAAIIAALTIAAAACGPQAAPPDPAPAAASPDVAVTQPPESPPEEPRRVDPREGGFEVGFGEFAVTLEAPAIRPGPVTFVIRNGGALVHGFEMEIEGDSSGPGSGDGFKIETETFDPGETLRVDLDLAPGLYKVECFVADHDDRGMEALLEVRPDAPRVRERSAAPDGVSIEGFAFAPEEITIAPGGSVTWTNRDPADHTVTADGGAFDSGPFGEGATFTETFEEPGTFSYHCQIHPSMTGSVTVA